MNLDLAELPKMYTIGNLGTYFVTFQKLRAIGLQVLKHNFILRNILLLTFPIIKMEKVKAN
jgi:hypothetical protein